MKPASPVLPGHEHVIKETVFGAGQPQYTSLPAVIVPGSEGEVLTRWEFSEEEKLAIANGASLYLSVMTFGRSFHPVLLRIASADEVMDEPRRVDLNRPVTRTLVHKDLPGTHNDSEDCWCSPTIRVEGEDSSASSTEKLAETIPEDAPAN